VTPTYLYILWRPDELIVNGHYLFLCNALVLIDIYNYQVENINFKLAEYIYFVDILIRTDKTGV
jgi:hypothetical protein